MDGDVGDVRSGDRPQAVLHGAHLIGPVRLGPDLDVVGLARQVRAGEGEAPVGGDRELRAPVREHEPAAAEAVDRAPDGEGGRRRRTLVVVDDGDRRAMPGAQRGAACVPERDGERLGRLGLGVFAQRDLDQPRPGVAGAEADRRRGRLEVAAGARRAAVGGHRHARAAARPAAAGDEDHRFALGLVHGEPGVAERQHARAARAPGAVRRLHRPRDRLLEPRLAAPLQSMGGQQRRLAMLRVLDEGLRAGLAAAVVDRLRLQTDVHGEQLAGVHGGQRDLQAARPVEPHHTERPRAAVVSVAVDVEPVVLPQRDLRVRGRRRAGPPGMLVALEVRDAAGVEEVAARRCRVCAGVEAHDGADRLAVAVRRAFPGRETAVGVDRLQQQVRDRDLQRGVAGALLVGLVLVEVGHPALHRSHPDGVRRRRLRHHRVLRAVGAREQAAERLVTRQEVPVRRVEREIEDDPPDPDGLEQPAAHLRAVSHRGLTGPLHDLAHRPEPHGARVVRRPGRRGEHERKAERHRAGGDAHASDCEGLRFQSAFACRELLSSRRRGTSDVLDSCACADVPGQGVQAVAAAHSSAAAMIRSTTGSLTWPYVSMSSTTPASTNLNCP